MKKYILYIWTSKYLIFAIIISIFAGLALCHPGLFPTHDGEYHIVRFYEFDKVLRSGELYPRWAPDFNFSYGIPLFNYVYPLPNFLASFLHSFGISFIDIFKMEMFGALVVGAIFFFLYAREFWGEQGGLVASAFYTFSPYHFVDIYIRGSIGEVLALGLFPFWLWSYTKFTRTKNVLYFFCSILGLSFIIFSHNILALMFFLFIFFYITFTIYQSKERKNIFLYSILILIFALSVTAVFWLPALLETKYVQGLQIYDIQQNFPDFFQLLFPSWGTGFFNNDLTNQMSVQIGLANLFAVGVAFFIFLKSFKEKGDYKKLRIFFLIGFLTTCFLITSFSSAIWQYAPLLNYFQFPWRLLSLIILISSFLAGSFFYKKRSIIWLFIFLGILFLTTYNYAYPAFYHMRDDNYYISRSNFMDGTNSPGNIFQTIWAKGFSSKPKNQAIIREGEGSIVLIKNSVNMKIFNAKLSTKSKLIFSTTYFPGWELQINKRIIMPSNESGLLSIHLPKGTYTITLLYSSTTIEKLSQFITLMSLGLIIAFMTYNIIVRKKYETL